MVSIIILTYNSSSHIEPMLQSIKEFAKNCEVLVIDNNSKDDTLKLADKFDFAKTFNTGENLGFAKGINFGAKKAKGDFLLFLNPDTLFKSGKIEDLIQVFDEKTAVVGGRLVDSNGKPEKSCGKFFSIFQVLLIALGLDEALGGRFSPGKDQYVDFVSGGLMMVKKSVFDKVGGFDEDYFMYVEDMDLCYRMKKTGYKVKFSSSINFSHLGQGSSGRGFAVINIYKGIRHFFKKEKNGPAYHIVSFTLRFKALTVYLLGKITNNSYYISTYGEVLKLF